MQSKNDQIETLTAFNEELENYFANTIISQLFVDAKLVLRKFTALAGKQFELKPEFIGRTIEDIEAGFRFSTITDNIRTVITTGKILDKKIQNTDMQWFQMNILPYPVRRENKIIGVIITCIDITTDIKDFKKQEKLIAKHKLLLGRIAHDIKNPLLVLGLTIETLKKLPENRMEKFPLLLEHLDTSMKQIKKVVNDMKRMYNN